MQHIYMYRARVATLALLLALVTVWALSGCAQNVRPTNTTEKIFLAQWTVIGATNAVADLRPVLDPADYEQAKAIVLQAALALNCAKWAAQIPGATQPANCPVPTAGSGSVTGYLNLVNVALAQAAIYYASKGD